MKLFLYIFSVFNSYFCFSQSLNYGKYYQLISEADVYLYEQPDYLHAAKILDSTLTYNGLPNNNLSAGIINFKLKRYGSTYQHLLKYAQSGNNISTIVDTLRGDSIFNFKKADLDFMFKKYPQLSREYSVIQLKSKKEFNVELNNELLKLFYKDQAIREVVDVFATRLDSCCRDTTNHFSESEFSKADSLIFSQLKGLINKFGLPLRHQVSNDAFLAFYFVLMHNYTNEMSHGYCDSIIAVAKNRFKTDVFITPHEYAMIIDRYYINTFGKNYYNEFCIPDLQLVEPENINYRRKEIFLNELKSPK